ncbi:DUF4250 domain-containing protein [Pelagicoccus sp. NFK12]|uniref:DUF4250 domain-containing protein n=1 Tax=Pelagicoccus enzymogenes TaxID=2773457 RepID=A0A927F6Q8_9BACT|nr:DUF4250 domain-containing protein [Pelagicoccus enzymogenes]MBD5778879.1 DUF4250 domain-containing protein [Pelagicoccus enzymogenes]
MDWSNIESMDPNLLVGVVNTALRNHYHSLEELCKSHDLDSERLKARLAEEDYEYFPAANQFR